MSKGEFLTRLTIWIALAGYFVGVVAFKLSRRRHRWESTARLAWTVGCVSLIAHVLCAFHFYHHWSHESAYLETARQTAEVTGLNWGGGLYINYALATGWVMDVIWWWRGLDDYRRRPGLLVAVWQSFLIFIIFNATVIFKSGPTRWLGVGLCLALGIVWLHSARTGLRRKADTRVTKDQNHGLIGH